MAKLKITELMEGDRVWSNCGDGSVFFRYVGREHDTAVCVTERGTYFGISALMPVEVCEDGYQITHDEDWPVHKENLRDALA